MSIQTTLNIKRSEAEEKFVNKLLEDQKIMFKKQSNYYLMKN